MSKTVVKENTEAGSVTKPKVERLQSYVSLTSTTIGICGAVGSLFVWLAANLYVGTVEITCPQAVDSVVVKVYDREGHEAVYHSKSFHLMPGNYHLEITLPDGKPLHKDVQVSFNQTLNVPVSMLEENRDAEASSSRKEKRHWWQFWRSKDEPAEPKSENP